jgi:tetratricopeptide (TPR) repeat protein
MRRILSSLCAALAALVAGVASAGDPAADDFERGSRALELRRYEEARAALESAVAANPSNARALLLLGIVELEQDHPDAAITRFEAARAADPALAQRVLYHEGLAHARAERPGEARAALERARALDPASRIGRGADALLSAAEPLPGAARRWRLSGSFGVEYDDNVTVSEIDESSGQGDGAALAEISGVYRLLDSERGALEAGYDFSQSMHFELEEADLQTHGLWLDGTRALGQLDAGLGARFDGVLLGGDGFLLLQELRPRLGIPVRPGWTAELAAGYVHKDFLESSDRDRDAHRASVGVDHFFRLADGRARARAGLRFEAEDARGAEFDQLGGVLATGLRVPFEWRGSWSADVGYQLRLRDYRHDAPEIAEPRRDLEQGVRVGLSRQLTPRVEARLEYRLTDADSNLPSADYLANAVGLRLRVDL